MSEASFRAITVWLPKSLSLLYFFTSVAGQVQVKRTWKCSSGQHELRRSLEGSPHPDKIQSISECLGVSCVVHRLRSDLLIEGTNIKVHNSAIRPLVVDGHTRLFKAMLGGLMLYQGGRKVQGFPRIVISTHANGPPVLETAGSQRAGHPYTPLLQVL